VTPVGEASFPRQVLSVVFRTAPLFQPAPGEPGTFAGRIRASRRTRAAEEATPEHQPGASGSAGQIETICLRAWTDIRGLAEAYRAGQPVLMDVSQLSPEDAKRSVDFAAGLIFGMSGSIKRVSSRLFLLAPPDRVREFADPESSRAWREERGYAGEGQAHYYGDGADDDDDFAVLWPLSRDASATGHGGPGNQADPPASGSVR
jgi:FtsZ-interacting cell division protein YlmF